MKATAHVSERVTDKAKERVGTQPAPFYGPAAARTPPTGAAEATLLSSSATPGSGVAVAPCGPLYRSGDLVFIRPLRATLWVAQLTEPVVEISPGCFNVDRPKCRYFVRTEALGGYPHALEWWEQRGVGLRLADEAAAAVRAAASDGVHFSFEKTDHVTRSTICGRFEPASVLEPVTWHNQLVSFAIPELTLAGAREIVSAATETQPATGARVADPTVVVREEKSRASKDEKSYEELARKREHGYQQQQQQRKKRAQQKQQ